jgi:hypothetical protein
MDSAYPGPQAAAVLDIGADMGAVLVNTGPDLSGREIELFDPAGRPVMHTEVHPRPVGDRTVHAGLFPAVRQGDYGLVLSPGGTALPVTVRGGEVSVLDVSRP